MVLKDGSVREPHRTPRPPASPPRVTIAQVARAAGVSTPTVSKVLNGRGDVGEATRARVEQAISRTNYQRRRPPSVASAAPVVELLFSEIAGEWAIALMRGVVAEARRHGAEVMVNERPSQPADADIDAILERRPVGLVLVFSQLDEREKARLDARRIPVVIVDPVGEVSPGSGVIGCNNFAGGRLATNYLVQLGHRRIAMITGPDDTQASRMRLAGYREALHSAGLPWTPATLRAGTYHVEAGYLAALDLLRSPEPPTAIFAGSDVQAFGVYRAAHECGLRIPEDLSVVGYDDQPMADWVTPRLTTVHQPLFEMAELATRLVFTIAADMGVTARAMELPVELVERESTCPPRPAAP